MLRKEKNGLVFYQSEKFQQYGFDGYFFTRWGGLSQGPFAELNLSLKVGDKPEIVRQNRELIQSFLSLKKLVMVWQIHSGKVIELNSERIDEEALRNTEADGLITDQAEVGIGVLCADCYPLILAETEKKILGICHCGRRGILEGIIENTINAFLRRGGKREKIIAGIGPGICGECYLVDSLVISEYQKKFPSGDGKIWRKNQGGYLLELKQAILQILLQQGIESNRIEDLNQCTYENTDFFSHRRDRAKTGRQLSLIMLK